MSEPRHVYLTPSEAYRRCGPHAGDLRYTLSSGPEWSALMERAREATTSRYLARYGDAMNVLEDILAYLGEQP